MEVGGNAEVACNIILLTSKRFQFYSSCRPNVLGAIPRKMLWLSVIISCFITCAEIYYIRRFDSHLITHREEGRGRGDKKGAREGDSTDENPYYSARRCTKSSGRNNPNCWSGSWTIIVVKRRYYEIWWNGQKVTNVFLLHAYP